MVVSDAQITGSWRSCFPCVGSQSFIASQVHHKTAPGECDKNVIEIVAINRISLNR